MKIALDIRYRTRSGGVSYANNIAAGLLAAGSGHDFHLLKFEGQELPFACQAPTVSLRRGSSAEQAIWDQVVLPRLLRKGGFQIYHPLKLMGTAFSPCPQLTVAHAISRPFRGEFPYTFSQRIYWDLLGSLIFRRSAAIIAVSGYVREFLIEAIGIPERRIHVIHHGTDPRFHRLPPSPEASPPSPPYLLTVGNIFPVKNFRIAVEALASLAGDHPTLRLKMAGATTHAHFNEIQALVERRGLVDRVDYLGFVPADGLVRLMNDAQLLLVPSLSEGFALTLLEGMACGAPVLASNCGAIPEVAGGAARLMDDPADAAAWAVAARQIVEQPALAESLRSAGLARAALFTWGKTVQRTLAVYPTL